MSITMYNQFTFVDNILVWHFIIAFTNSTPPKFPSFKTPRDEISESERSKSKKKKKKKKRLQFFQT